MRIIIEIDDLGSVKTTQMTTSKQGVTSNQLTTEDTPITESDSLEALSAGSAEATSPDDAVDESTTPNHAAPNLEDAGSAPAMLQT